MKRTIIPLLAVAIQSVLSQSYTFPLSPAGQSYPQYNNAYESRYPYIPNQQQMPMQMPMQQGPSNGYSGMNGIGVFRDSNPMANRFQFNPMSRVQVQPPMQDPSPFSSQRVTAPVGPSEYRVDQKAPKGPTRIIPPFLKSASVAEKDKFYEIVQHPTWSGFEKNQRIEELMKTMSEERQTMYSDFRRDIVDKEMEEKRRNVDRAVSQMTKEAVDQFQRVVQIMHDPAQSETEKLKKIEEIYSKLPDAIRKEFDEKLKGF
uniref:DUF148 domain-containing protein n=1 Tax=Caenorhabditis japonica TaxID=281687 RepID=A0A8R1DXC1_CAEJA